MQRMSGGCLEGVLMRVSGRYLEGSVRFLEGVWKVSEECMEGQARVGKVKTGQVRTCLVRTEQSRTGHVGICQPGTGQVGIGQDWTTLSKSNC